ncbi:hypothetical protein DFH09DRAFT_1206090 [Mycena vulgaris]|nr:hypothetical protein DFH09DRAFT_1206090 [Mycena vulgaris]
MKFTATAAAILSVLFRTQLTLAAGCSGSECAQLYHGSGCDSHSILTDFVPTCEGNCFQFSSFDSVLVSGNGFKGTNCHIYSDNNCQNQVSDTGNQVEIGNCVNTPGAQSMKCFFDC